MNTPLELASFPIFNVGGRKIRLIELFGGIGSQAMGLRNLGADFEHHGYVEIDKYAVSSYNAIFGTDFAPTDIKEVTGESLKISDLDDYVYFMTYSFPCTDLSNAGQKLGMAKGSGTRSSLLWEVERILSELKQLGTLPQVLLMENVTQVHGARSIQDFETWLGFLDSIGYTTFWFDMNAKDYGIAQSRNRCFAVSLLGQFNFEEPEPIPLTTTMRDYLEDEVEEKYFINTPRSEELIKELIADGTIEREVSNAIRIGGGGEHEQKAQLGQSCRGAVTTL